MNADLALFELSVQSSNSYKLFKDFVKENLVIAPEMTRRRYWTACMKLVLCSQEGLNAYFKFGWKQEM